MNKCTWLAAITSLLALIPVSATAQLTAVDWVSGLSAPIQMVQDPVFTNVKYVIQQTGRVRVIQNGAIQPFDFIDLTGKITALTPLNERGLLGMEFAPDYASSGHVYFNYTDRNGIGNTQIARYTRSAVNPLQLDTTTEYRILNVVQPFENHNGGTLRFGADGYLYIGFGDGGSGNDPGNRAQSPNTLLGKMIRIDVSQDAFPTDPERNYAIPPDNPFIDNIPIPAMHEIWAFGYRNPYRWSFDRASLGGTNAMIVGDVGQNSWEEIDYEPAGAGERNYGWRVREGAHNTGLTGTAYLPFTDPIHEYSRGTGAAVVGGYVYRGNLLPGFNGRYFFADYVQRRVWSVGLSIGAGGEATAFGLQEHTAELGGSAFLGNISSIDIDQSGEIFLVSRGGKIMRILPAGPIAVSPDVVQVIEGRLVSGGPSQLAASDDQYVVAQRWKSPASGPHVQLIIEGTSARLTSSQITLQVEARVNIVGIIQTIEAYNFAANSWTLLDSISAPTTDTLRSLTITSSPSNYIQPGTGKVRIRLGFGETSPFLPRWSSYTDFVRWTINP
jgi:glucose/arabinose dehydrogenase